MFDQEIQVLSQDEVEKIDSNQIVNINVGIMGHIDSGKTSIAKTLTVTKSTNSLDKNPQSQEKGITIDLGFSAFCVQIQENQTKFDKKFIQISLVDCPGHAQFIKSVIAGASIIDLMILVVDVQKGIQTQTAECLALGEQMKLNLVVVLNKIDLIEVEKRQQFIQKKIIQFQKLFAKTQFKNSQNIPIIEYSCKENTKSMINNFIISILSIVDYPRCKKEFSRNIMIADHCFDLKNKGTVITGTVIEGEFSVNDNVEIPETGEKIKIKSMQSYKKIKTIGKQGDRIALMTPTLKGKKLERFFITKDVPRKLIEAFIAEINFCPYYKFPIKSQSKIHVSIAHLNIMCTVYLFSVNEKLIEEEIYQNQYEYVQEITKDKIKRADREEQWEQQKIVGLFLMQKSQFLFEDNFLIGSKFDFQQHQKFCRIAFSGQTLINFQNQEEIKQNIKIFSKKTKVGSVHRVVDSYTVIVWKLFKKDSNIKSYLNHKVIIDNRFEGKIEGQFGTQGKVKVILEKELTEDLKDKSVELPYKKFYKIK